MHETNDFTVRRRADGSIDPGVYRNRAKRLHSASFAEAARRLMGIFRSDIISQPTWQRPSAFWLASDDRDIRQQL